MEFNLPGLFRYGYQEAHSSGRLNVTFIIPECDKDEFIYELRETRFIKEHSGFAAVPMYLQISAVCFTLEASDILDSGTIIMEFRR